MEFRNNVTMTAPASSNNAIQRVQRGTNRPVGKINGRIKKQLSAASEPRSITHSQVGWRTVTAKGNGIFWSGNIAIVMDTNSTIQLSDLRQNNPAAIIKYASAGIPICRAASQPYWSSDMRSFSSTSTWSG